ncbi:phage minor capsid protein [Bacillus sp. S70]|nr:MULTISPECIES: phage minor capsid protein [unclassified Bacillus (in: firmicutes)]MBJ9983575.1 phage minor capsid protein [Bacillus sp. S29]MBK0104764.1 phage minor capsid protein [Bacillus sp. S70]MBK0110025.1 phage minor capsid protein [Bacillus sp. S73]MBK0138891.1 phage minor capsid protein [Bacillus sp. S72]MBK0147996.1 phage minor capsid protein [Bacillus sp. S74]
MALPPEKLQQLSMFVVDIYNAIEEELLLNMARMLKYDRELLLTAENFEQYQHWRIVQLNKLGKLNQQQMDTISRHSSKTAEEVRKMLEGAGFTAVEQHEPLYQEAVQAGSLAAAPAMHTSAALIGILNTYEQQALDTLNLVNTTMLKQSQQVYLDVLNKTVGKLLGGVITPQQALRQTVSEWSQRGIPALIDKAGRRWGVEGYVSMCARSTSQNVANGMQDERMKEYDVDLCEVSSYPGARPKCFEDQGKIYSLSSKHPKYKPLSSTSYGEPDGLFGINCSHIRYPYIEGLSTQRYFPHEDIEENRKIYKQSQQQRAIERRIRKAKREVRVMEALGDQEGANNAKNKVSQQQSVMRDFIKNTKRTRRYDREKLY